MKKIFFAAIVLLMLLFSPKFIPGTVAEGTDTASLSTAASLDGVFYNTDKKAGGTVSGNMDLQASSASGYINFTQASNDPETLCGAGNYSGSRSGNNLSLSFVSSDPDAGCGFDHGQTFTINSQAGGDNISRFWGGYVGGTLPYPNGVFETWTSGNAPQQYTYTGRFHNPKYGVGGPITIRMRIGNNTVYGDIDFDGDPGYTLCGAGNFYGKRNGNSIEFSFVSQDNDSGCTMDDGWRFILNGTLSSDFKSITNGSYSVPSINESGTFYASTSSQVLFSASGQVTDNLGNPVSGASVSKGTGSTTTDSSGNYSFSNLSPGTYTLSSSKSGYNGCTPASLGVSGPGSKTGQNFVCTPNTSPDTTPPTGNITAPINNVRIGPGTIPVSANASDNSGGSGVNRVEFYASYDGKWHGLGADYSSPYSKNWQTPSGLRSQIVKFGLHLYDNAGNFAYGSEGRAQFIESQDNPSIVESSVPASRRAYLNQRSLSPYGDSKCGSASAAMVLAMNGKIGKDYNSMRDTANAIYPKTIKNGSIYAYLVAAEMRKRGLEARERKYTFDNGWNKLKSEINAGRPVIILSWKVTSGHFFVVVGYREQGSNRQIIVYDPYGKWKGVKGRYDRNTTSSGSAKGKWVYYDLQAVWGGWMITARPQTRAADDIGVIDDIPPIEPDLISDEPEDIGTYEGIDIHISQNIYLPIVIKNK